jgi:hypothetical protein
MSLVTFDLQELYSRTFGGRLPIVVKESVQPVESRPFFINTSNTKLTQIKGSILSTEYLGKEIWMPIEFKKLDPRKFGVTDLLLPYSVISLESKKTIIKTSLSERIGTVKELYGLDDFNITIKGFLIDENRKWPEKELLILNELFSLNESIEINNVMTDLFLGKDGDKLVTIEDLKFPAIENGWKHIRPFSMKLVSDEVFTLDA